MYIIKILILRIMLVLLCQNKHICELAGTYLWRKINLEISVKQQKLHYAN